MAQKTKNAALKSWDEFLKLQDDYETKMEKLRESQLGLISPQSQRPLAWVHMINPEFAGETIDYFQSAKSQELNDLPNGNKAFDDSQNVWTGPLASLKTPDREEKISRIINIFINKRPDIGYAYGMKNIAAVLVVIFTVESDAFVIFAHIIENVFPEGYFQNTNRKLAKHKELRIFELMAEKMRPKLLVSLKAVFKPSGRNVKEQDITPFILTMKRLGDVWFSTLFSTILFQSDLLRIWDNMFIYGFSFLQKFGLVLLSKHEGTLKNHIKRETKSLGIGATVDSLIIAGNAGKNKLNANPIKLPIEKLLKKAHTKPRYKELKSSLYNENAQRIESDHLERLHKLRECKRFLRGKGQTFAYNEALDAFRVLNSIQRDGKVSRTDFILSNDKFKWTTETAVSVFSTFDQNGEDKISLNHLKGGLAVLAEIILEQKLELLFFAFDRDHSGMLDPGEIINLMSAVEIILDEKSNTFYRVSTPLYSRMDRNQDGRVVLSEFIKCVKDDSACAPILDFIAAIESELDINVKALGLIENGEDGSYSDIHSPMRRSQDGSSISDISYDREDGEYPRNMYEEYDVENNDSGNENESEHGEEEVDIRKYSSKKAAHFGYGTRGGDEDVDLKKYSSRKAVEDVDAKKYSSRKAVNQNHRNSETSHTLESEEEYKIKIHPQAKTRHSLTQKPINIEIPPSEETEKEQKRGTCNRLCTRETCLIF
ncbi:unnamed protein product [Blepharisma stoltei]|uniref:Uncharacterized protein n=1 Tax=Blepharisma stoltei TaxID=1481888 RepID=A0AAU9KBC9_9CILI|nr:unnamed protein product [Blepharisma stoltei]